MHPIVIDPVRELFAGLSPALAASLREGLDEVIANDPDLKTLSSDWLAVLHRSASASYRARVSVQRMTRLSDEAATFSAARREVRWMGEQHGTKDTLASPLIHRFERYRTSLAQRFAAQILKRTLSPELPEALRYALPGAPLAVLGTERTSSMVVLAPDWITSVWAKGLAAPNRFTVGVGAPQWLEAERCAIRRAVWVERSAADLALVTRRGLLAEHRPGGAHAPMPRALAFAVLEHDSDPDPDSLAMVCALARRRLPEAAAEELLRYAADRGAGVDRDVPWHTLPDAEARRLRRFRRDAVGRLRPDLSPSAGRDRSARCTTALAFVLTGCRRRDARRLPERARARADVLVRLASLGQPLTHPLATVVGSPDAPLWEALAALDSATLLGVARELVPIAAEVRTARTAEGRARANAHLRAALLRHDLPPTVASPTGPRIGIDTCSPPPPAPPRRAAA